MQSRVHPMTPDRDAHARPARRCPGWVVAVHIVCVAASAAAAQESIPAQYPRPEPFLAAIEAERPAAPQPLKLTGIAVPHHLLAADLIARGFWAASAGSYDRIVVLSPDHFNRSRRPLATTRQDFATPFGTIRNDTGATEALLANTALFDDSDLFGREHGVGALLPFVRHFFPDARLVPIAVSYGSTQPDWDAAVAALQTLLTPGTLVVQSTDYSHYLTQQVAVRRDQETLNVIAANDPAMVARLVQPDHMDSKGSQYIQMRLQTEVGKSHGIVIANRSSAEYSAIGTKTTSYIVTVYANDREAGATLRYQDQDVVYFGGDTFIGRWLTQPLADPDVAQQVVARIRSATGGAPLILNLEGVVLDDPPLGVSADLHVMHASLALPMLKALNVRAVSLANNHSHDLGRTGVRESVGVLKRAGIAALPHMSALDLERFGLVAVNFIGVRDYRGYPVVKRVGELQRICRMKVRAPLVAFVHWGEEYTDSAQPADHAAAQALHACGVDLIVGAHSHRAAARIDAPQGGEFQMVFSLGNLLFDQRGDRASAALLELRLFGQGTFAARLVPLPNLFDLASDASARRTARPAQAETAKP